MYKRILIALDLEGVNNVAGVPYEGLVKGCGQWKIAKEQGVLEVNAAARALFDAGAETVALWDNHGGSGNVDPDALDSRIRLITHDHSVPRMSFAKDAFDCICFFGYHAMEGTLGGVLAHTMSSVSVQHYKLNGKYIGEVDMDAWIAAEYGMPSRFYAGGNIACSQAVRAVPEIVTVTTKEELSRNQANFRDNDELFRDIAENIVKAVSTEAEPHPLAFPAVMEKSFKRVEDAAKYLGRLRAAGMDACHPDDEILGKDAHTVVCTVHDILEFIRTI